MGSVVALGLIGVMAILALGVWQVASLGSELAPGSDDTAFLALGWLAMLLVLGTGVGLVWILLRDRDLAAAYIVVAGAVTGITAAVIAAPIAANLFGGVTGSGGDFVVAAFRQAGADLEQAVLGQSLVSDSIDKVVTYFVVYLILGDAGRAHEGALPAGSLPAARRRHGDTRPAAWDRRRQPLRCGPERALPAGVRQAGPTAWHRLDPLTKLSRLRGDRGAPSSRSAGSRCWRPVARGGAPAGRWPRRRLAPCCGHRCCWRCRWPLSAALVNLLFTPLGGDPGRWWWGRCA